MDLSCRTARVTQAMDAAAKRPERNGDAATPPGEAPLEGAAQRAPPASGSD
jgi:hypothetical protein